MKSKFLPILPVIFLGLGISSYANAASNDYSGFFGGISGGMSNTFGRLNGNSNITFIDNATVHTNTLGVVGNKIRGSHFKEAGDVKLGYSGLFGNRFFLGGELGVGYLPGHLKGKFNSNSSANDGAGSFFNATLQIDARGKLRSWEYVADLTPGVLLCDTFLLFVRVGVAVNRIRLDTNTTFQYTDSILTNVNLQMPLSAKKRRAALRLGVGVAHYIADNLILNVNYTYTYYGKITVSGIRNVPDLGNGAVANGFTSSTTAKFNRQAFMIGLNYYFGSSR